jgi:hypothetical protein
VSHYLEPTCAKFMWHTGPFLLGFVQLSFFLSISQIEAMIMCTLLFAAGWVADKG